MTIFEVLSECKESKSMVEIGIGAAAPMAAAILELGDFNGIETVKLKYVSTGEVETVSVSSIKSAVRHYN